MNILDKNYNEISFKTDAEDIKVMIDFIENFSSKITIDHYDIKKKSAASLLKEIRDKLVVKEAQKRSVKKAFLMKFKPYQLYPLLEAFAANEEINQGKIFEKTCIQQYKNLFHQKLTGL